MPEFDEASIFLRAEGCEMSPVADGRVVYQPGRDRVHFLNPTGFAVYELCDGEHSVGWIATFLQDAFGLDERPAENVRQCIDSLLTEELVVPCSRSSSGR